MLGYEGSEHKTIKVNAKSARDVTPFLPSISDAVRDQLCIVNGMSEKYAICHIMELAFSVLISLLQGVWVCNF